MRVLLLSFYFRPDLSAGAFRSSMLAEALVREMPPGGIVEVLTTQPNRYGSFVAHAPATEKNEGLHITRIALPTHAGGMYDQAWAFLSYVRVVLSQTQKTDYDIVCATSSRLMTACLGAWIAHRRQVPLYLDIRDIFVDTIKDVLPKPVAWLATPLLALLERVTILRASRTNLVSAGFRNYFSSRYPSMPLSFFTNGIDEEFLKMNVREDIASQNPTCVEILYAGNLGDGQGMDKILPGLARRLAGRARFRVIGDGGRQRALVSALVNAGVDNVDLLPPVSRQELIAAYHRCDMLFLHLNSYDAFKKVLPSKLFEYGATGKPILAGIDGYAASFVRNELSNSAVFQPCDAEAGARAFSTLSLDWTDRSDFISRYGRQSIMRAMAQDVIGLLNARS